MDSAARQLIEQLHATPHQFVLALTGGGAQTAGHILSIPGASRTILEVIVPYHQQSLIQFLGHFPEQSCSIEASRLMARRAFEKATQLAPSEKAVGLGCTASLASDRPKRGEHRFHVTIHEGTRATTWSLVLSKGARDRVQEEEMVVHVILNALAEIAQIEQRLDLMLHPDENVEMEKHVVGDPLTLFLHGETDVVCIAKDGRARNDAPLPKLLMPGSFYPLHEGHRALAEVASFMENVPVAFEISVSNADKGEIALEGVRSRLKQFEWYADLWLTRAPTFVQKARLLPGVTFVLGLDTQERLVMPKYYNDCEEEMAKAFAEIRSQGCSFLVGGRADDDGTFRTLSDSTLPSHCHDLFREIPENHFRVDVSSTALRNNNSGT